MTRWSTTRSWWTASPACSPSRRATWRWTSGCRFARLWAEDAVYRVPVTPEGVPGQLEGRDAIVSGLDGFFDLFGATDFTWDIERMADRDKVFATWSLDIELVAGGRYVNRGSAVFELERGRIVEFDEWFDTAAYLRVFGV